MNKIHYSNCPVCTSENIKPLLTVKDHSVSKEEFVIWQCGSCTVRFTQDVPDEDSIAKYYQSPDYISHTNTTKGLVNTLYQSVRKQTLKQKASLIISQTKPVGKLLDVGAGIGAFVNAMQQRGWKATGLEPDAGARQKAKELFSVNLLETDAIENFPHNSFDAITLWHVLEHVHQLHNYVEKLKELLVRDGKLFIAVPNYTALDADIYRPYWAAYDVPRHLYHFSPKSMEVLLQKHGLRITQKKPMWYDSFYISLLSTKYYKGRASWLSAGFAGLRSNINAMLHNDAASSLIYIAEKS